MKYFSSGNRLFWLTLCSALCLTACGGDPDIQTITDNTLSPVSVVSGATTTYSFTTSYDLTDGATYTATLGGVNCSNVMATGKRHITASCLASVAGTAAYFLLKDNSGKTLTNVYIALSGAEWLNPDSISPASISATPTLPLSFTLTGINLLTANSFSATLGSNNCTVSVASTTDLSVSCASANGLTAGTPVTLSISDTTRSGTVIGTVSITVN